LAWVAVAAWQVSKGGTAVPLAAIFGAFGLFRLASAVTLFRLDGISVRSSGRREIIAGWLFIGRTAAMGAALVGFSIAAMVLRPHAAGFIFGGIGLLVGQALFVFGMGLVRQWRNQRRTAIRGTDI
jgi:hypothetical protein